MWEIGLVSLSRRKVGYFAKIKKSLSKTYREFTPCLLILLRKWSVEIIF